RPAADRIAAACLLEVPRGLPHLFLPDLLPLAVRRIQRAGPLHDTRRVADVTGWLPERPDPQPQRDVEGRDGPARRVGYRITLVECAVVLAQEGGRGGPDLRAEPVVQDEFRVADRLVHVLRGAGELVRRLPEAGPHDEDAGGIRQREEAHDERQDERDRGARPARARNLDRKSTRLNSSHVSISY